MSQDLTHALVSVIVVTYLSSDYVLETLDSIARQSYENIQLIIADDGSTDDTVPICTHWLQAHQSRFPMTKLAASGQNGGIVANCNNGWRYARGHWVKFIGGDDVLMENCIRDFMEFVGAHPGYGVVFSGMRLMDERSQPLGRIPAPVAYLAKSPEQQLLLLLQDNEFLKAPAAFIQRSLLESSGGFDPRFPMIEDYPFWVSQLSQGCRFGCLDKETVRYRIHDKGTSTAKRLHTGFVQSRRDADREVRLPAARRISRSLARRVRLDIWLFDMQADHPLLFKLMHPFLWLLVKWRSLWKKNH